MAPCAFLGTLLPANSEKASMETSGPMGPHTPVDLLLGRPCVSSKLDSVTFWLNQEQVSVSVAVGPTAG